MATKPNDWPQPPEQPEELPPSGYQKTFFRVIGACVCVVAIATSGAAVSRLVCAMAEPCQKGGAV